jgi:hypothetical protein
MQILTEQNEPSLDTPHPMVSLLSHIYTDKLERLTYMMPIGRIR